jgi:competence protein ComFC
MPEMAVLGAAISALEEAIFPGRCLACGEWLLPAGDHSIPVCSNCCEKLPILAEPRCARCGVELISEKGTCLRCRASDHAFDSNLSVFAYSGNARRLLVSMKFEHRRRLAPFFAALAYGLLNASGWDGPVVPVPPRPGRRDPDVPEIVARCLVRFHGVRVLRTLLRTAGTQQKSLDYTRRRENLKGQVSLSPRARQHFAVEPPNAACRAAVLLDDVFTTGATLDACAQVLREAGYTTVNAVTLVMEE